MPRSLARVDAGPAGIAPLRGVIVDVDWVTTLEHLHGAIVLASSYLDDQDRMPTAQPFRVKMRVFIRHGVAFNGSPVVEVAAIIQKLHLGVIDAGFGQRLARGAGPIGVLKRYDDSVAGPIVGLISRAHCRGVHRAVSVQDRLDARPVGIGNPYGHKRAATPHAFSIGVSFLFADTGLRQRADQATGGAAGDGDCHRRSKPPRSDNRPDPWYSQEAETGKQTCDTADRRADPGARRGAFGPIVPSVGIPIDALGSVPIEPAVIVVRNDADIAVRNSRAFQLGDDACAGVMVLVKPRDGGH